MKLRAVNDRIIIIRDNAVDKTSEAGIIVLAAVQDAPQTATVVGVGNGLYETRTDYSAGHDLIAGTQKWRKHIPVAVGDKILIGKYSGAEVDVDGKHYTIIGPEDVLAVIEG